MKNVHLEYISRKTMECAAVLWHGLEVLESFDLSASLLDSPEGESRPSVR